MSLNYDKVVHCISVVRSCIKAWLFHPSLIWHSIQYRELPVWTKEEIEDIEKKVKETMERLNWK